MRKIPWVLLALAFAGPFGCGLIVDGAAGERDSESGIDTSPAVVLDAPAVTRPVEGARVVNPLVVEGYGVAGAEVTADLYVGGSSIAVGLGTVGDDSQFRLVLDSFSPPPVGTELTLKVSQENELGTSPDTEVGLKYEPVALSGVVTGPNDGMGFNKVYVRLYESKDDVLGHIQETVLTNPTISGSEYQWPYDFLVGDGNYYLRAFRDEFGGCDNHHDTCSYPDGQPTLLASGWRDQQARSMGPFGVNQTIEGDFAVSEPLYLDDFMMDPPKYEVDFFDVYTYHESYEPEPPIRDMGMSFELGEGLCKGYHMKIQTLIAPPGGAQPMVVLPDGKEVELLDDGGCGMVVGDNSAASYDSMAMDGEYSFGWPEPLDEDAGAYTLYLYDSADDVVHIQVDKVDTIQKMSRKVRLIEPTGNAVWPSDNLDASWDPVPGAAGYDAWFHEPYCWNSEFCGYLMSNISSATTLPNPYWDDSSRSEPSVLQILTLDNVPFGTESDVDARALSHEYYFITSDNQAPVMNYTGDIVDESGAGQADYYLQLETRIEMDPPDPNDPLDGPQSSMVIPPFVGPTGMYDLTYLDSPNISGWEITGFIDVDRSGDPNSAENRFYNVRTTSNSPTWPTIRFGPPLRIEEPTDNATGVDTEPTFKWEELKVSPPGPGGYSYILFVDTIQGEDGFPAALWGIPSGEASHSLNDTQNAYDLVFGASCILPPSTDGPGGAGGLIQGGTCSNGPTSNSVDVLLSGKTFQWSLFAVDCPYPDVGSDPEVMTYLNCVMPLFLAEGTGAHATSPSFLFSTAE